ncbi:L,D-transpeptidase [Thermoflexus sp.]|uniref:L,D-transpeptidase n=1 Tax=Thermoflexus sp. TaxID=1969742 RepID=UPI0035E42734
MRSVEEKALRWACRALQTASPEEALWWAARTYTAAPAFPAVRAVVRRIRRRFPNARGRPPARWSRWMVRIRFLYGLSMLIALFLIAWGLGVVDLWALLRVEELSFPEAIGWDPIPDTAADLRKQDPPDPISAAHPEESAPTGAWPSPHPTSPPDPLPTPPWEETPSPVATASFRPRPLASPTPLPGRPFPSRWILVDLSDQELTAYEGETPILRTKVSTGRPRTPTVVGTFRIYLKVRAQTMTGPGYWLPNVPYVMYFYQGYALHGTYWHNNFGQPMSHGCVNLPTPVAEQLYQWADLGTPVVMQP